MARSNAVRKRHHSFLSRAGRKNQTRSVWGNLFITLLLIIVGAFMALPLVYAILNSFKPIEELFVYPPRFYVKRPVLSNYTMLFKLVNNLMVPFSRYVFNSVMVCVVLTIGQILIASSAAYTISKYHTKLNWIFHVVVIALLFNGTVLAIPQYIILNSFRLLNTPFAYILPSLASALGLFLMKQFIDQVPDALLEAAKIDGANHYQTFWRIIMPSVKPAWLTLLIFSFQAIWSKSGGSIIYNEELKLLPDAISQVISGSLERQGVSVAGSVLLILPPILLFVLTQSNVIETMTSSGIKE